MRAARITQVKQPLEVQELSTPKPTGSQVLVRYNRAVFVIVIFTYGKEDMTDRQERF